MDRGSYDVILTEISLLYHHLRQLHEGIDVVGMSLEDVVETIPICLLQHLEESQLRLPVRPRVIIRPPLPCICRRFGTRVARDGEDSAGWAPACFWRSEEGSRTTERGRVMRVVGEPCVVSRLWCHCRRVDLENESEPTSSEQGTRDSRLWNQRVCAALRPRPGIWDPQRTHP